jgi:hypothetical protein
MTMRFPEEIPENERAGRADLCLYLSPSIKWWVRPGEGSMLLDRMVKT